MSDREAELNIWHQVADAGFGAAVEESGFRRVGRTMWRRDSDRVAWRVSLARGYVPTPRSFRGSYGGYVKDVDDLVKLFHPGRKLENMPGTRVPWHLGGGLEDDTTEEEIRAYRTFWEARMARPTGWRGFWEDLINPLPPEPTLTDSRIPFYGSAGVESSQAAFVVGGAWDVAAVANVLVKQWQDFALPWIEDRFSFAQTYARRWGPEAHRGGRHFCYKAESYAAAKLMGDQAWIDTMAEMAFAEGRVTYDEVWEELRKSGRFDQRHIKSGEIDRETLARNVYRGRLMPGATVLEIADAMSVRVPAHGIDFNAVGERVSIYRP